MRFDLHCHTKGGSIDSSVSLQNYIRRLKEQDFQGMMITDHDTYKGYKVWNEIKYDPEFRDFVVLRGLEYDTKDAGHFLVIMPNHISLKVLHVRGMSIKMLTRIVHFYGGILGPAHPFGVRSSSAMFFRKMKRNPHLMKEFDFVEGFNTCESPKSNRLARKLAARYGKLCIGGSDAHNSKYVGMAFTDIDSNVRDNNDMIEAVKDGLIVDFGGQERGATKKDFHKNAPYAVLGFTLYNRGLGYIFSPYRMYKIRKLAISHLTGH